MNSAYQRRIQEQEKMDNPLTTPSSETNRGRALNRGSGMSDHPGGPSRVSSKDTRAKSMSSGPGRSSSRLRRPPSPSREEGFASMRDSQDSDMDSDTALAIRMSLEEDMPISVSAKDRESKVIDELTPGRAAAIESFNKEFERDKLHLEETPEVRNLDLDDFDIPPEHGAPGSYSPRQEDAIVEILGLMFLPLHERAQISKDYLKTTAAAAGLTPEQLQDILMNKTIDPNMVQIVRIDTIEGNRRLGVDTRIRNAAPTTAHIVGDKSAQYKKEF